MDITLYDASKQPLGVTLAVLACVLLLKAAGLVLVLWWIVQVTANG